MSFAVVTRVGGRRVFGDDIPQVHFELIAPVVPWSTNDERKISPHTRASYVEALKTNTRMSFRRGRHSAEERRLAPGRVGIIIPFETKRRRDPHNYCGTVLKSIIDGMVGEGAWPDDTPEYVGHIEPILEHDPSGKGRIFVAVFPLGQHWSYRA